MSWRRQLHLAVAKDDQIQLEKLLTSPETRRGLAMVSASAPWNYENGEAPIHKAAEQGRDQVGFIIMSFEISSVLLIALLNVVAPDAVESRRQRERPGDDGQTPVHGQHRDPPACRYCSQKDSHSKTTPGPRCRARDLRPARRGPRRRRSRRQKFPRRDGSGLRRKSREPGDSGYAATR